MKLVNLTSDFLNYYNFINCTSAKKLGLLIDLPEHKVQVLLPITSFKEKYSEIKKYDSKYQVLSDKNGNKLAVIKVSDYIVCDNNFVKRDLTNDLLLQLEYESIKREEYNINKKLNDILKDSARLKRRRNILKNYRSKNADELRKFGLRFFNQVVHSITLFEDLQITPKDIETITNLSDKPITLTGHDSKILQNSINGWDFILDTLGDPTTVDYIIKLNGILAKDQALEIGKLRSGSGGYVVGSVYSPPIPNENDVKDMVEKYLISTTNLMHDVLEYFCYATKSQLFWDGNKRTSFLIVNKLLIENGLGIFYIEQELRKEFNDLLSEHYNKSHIDVTYKDNLIAFIKEKCIRIE